MYSIIIDNNRKLQNKKRVKKVLFINQEIAPYVPDSEMALLGKNMPQAIYEQGNEIRTFMPKWGNINERRNQLHEVIRLSGINLIINDTDHPLIIKVASIPASRVQVYFIDNVDYFSKRHNMALNEKGEEYVDNGERAIFFARGVLETVKKLRWTPDIIHCQGWMSAVVPFYIKKAYNEEPCFAECKVVTSLFHNDLHGKVSENFKESVAYEEAKSEMLDGYKEDFDFNELAKFAIDYSDGIIEADKDVNPDLLSYAENKDIPLLRYPGEESLGEQHNAFYEKL